MRINTCRYGKHTWAPSRVGINSFYCTRCKNLNSAVDIIRALEAITTATLDMLKTAGLKPSPNLAITLGEAGYKETP